MSIREGISKALGFQKPTELRVNDLLQRLTRRAERLDPVQQAETFVSLGGMEYSLSNAENRVIFGRRGTGKTHIMSFVAQTARKKHEIALQIDLRSVGSNSYLYIDESLPVAERATRLLRDFVASIHDKLLEEITSAHVLVSAHRLEDAVDLIGGSVKEILVRDTVEIKRTAATSSEAGVQAELKAKASLATSSIEARGNADLKGSAEATEEITETAHTRLSVNIGQVSRCLAEFAALFDKRVWVLVDEWSSLPESLQPYLADFLKRCLFPISNYTVHIAAIERRSNFRLGSGAKSIGIELGSDAAADINIDDYLVFENNPARAIGFFQEMLYRHIVSVAEGQRLPFQDAAQFVGVAFTQAATFRELVRASEGVPRDAINILQLAANHAQQERISIPHIRMAAKDWYDRDKAAYLATNAPADDLLQWIVSIVIGKRRAKAFLVASNVRNEYLERLFDERILHIAKRSYSAKYDPTKRYRIWKIDYGCYVDRINTSQAPTGFLDAQQDVADEGFIVPEDDFRAIRHAVLDLDNFGIAEELYRSFEPYEPDHGDDQPEA